MSIYAGLNVSDKTTHICVVNVDGKVLRRDVVASDPDALAKWLNKHCSDLARVVLETGTLSTFLYHGLVERGVAIECICARHAKGVLSVAQGALRSRQCRAEPGKATIRLQAWGRKIAEAKGTKRARTAVARKLAA